MVLHGEGGNLIYIYQESNDNFYICIYRLLCYRLGDLKLQFGVYTVRVSASCNDPSNFPRSQQFCLSSHFAKRSHTSTYFLFAIIAEL